MEFRVGPYVYTVRQVAGYIDHEGESCLGLCDNHRHELLISDQASPAQQLQVLCHEFMEAWVYHFGANLSDKEDYCDLFGLAMTQFVLDLVADMQPMFKPDAAAAVKLLLPALEAKVSRSSQRVEAADEDESLAPRPYRVTRIYEPAPPGSSKPWLMRLVD